MHTVIGNVYRISYRTKKLLSREVSTYGIYLESNSGTIKSCSPNYLLSNNMN